MKILRQLLVIGPLIRRNNAQTAPISAKAPRS